MRGWELDSAKELGVIVESVTLNDVEDSLIWRGNHGMFTTKDFYYILDQYNEKPAKWYAYWKLKIPTRIKMFLWKATNQVLPLRSFLSKRIIGISVYCPFCNQESETIEHLFWKCNQVQGIWSKFMLWWNVLTPWKMREIFFLSLMNISNIHYSQKEVWKISISLVWWNIWKARNAAIFKESAINQDLVTSLVKNELMVNCIDQKILSYNEASLWFINPTTALVRFTVNNRIHFLTNWLSRVESIGFSDGVWKATTSRSGLGGVISDRNLNIVFACSGPSNAKTALEAKIKACIYMWQVLGELGHNKRYLLCVDSKNTVEIVDKAKAGLEDPRNIF